MRSDQTAAKIVKQHLDFISRLDLILHGVHFLWKRKKKPKYVSSLCARSFWEWAGGDDL